MRLYDNKGNTYQAHAEKRPQFRHGVFGRTWDIETKTIDGAEVKMTWDTSWGNWYHFEWSDRWYRLRIYETYNSEELGAYEIKELFTHKGDKGKVAQVTTREFCPVCYGSRYADLELYDDGSSLAAFKCLRCNTVHHQRVWGDFAKEGLIQYDMAKFWKIINRLKEDVQ